MAVNKWEPTPEYIEQLRIQLAMIEKARLGLDSGLLYTPPPILTPSPIVPAKAPSPNKTVWETMGITREAYEKMGILPDGQRLGVGEKEQYYRKLGDAYAEGYLPKEIFEYRQQFIDNATTKTQCEAVFKDLEEAVKAKQLQITTVVDTPRRLSPVMTFIPGIVMLIIAISLSMHGPWNIAPFFYCLAAGFAIVEATVEAGKIKTRGKK